MFGSKVRRPTIEILLCLALSLLWLAANVNAAGAAFPGVPQMFSGTVTVAGSLAGAGLNVVAKSGGVEIGATTTDAQGRYGLAISADTGATIDFYINGVKANQTASYVAGQLSTLNLTAATAGSGGTSSLTISTASLPNATVGASYSQTVVASGGAGSYTFTLASGSGPLPGGLSMNAAGSITGTPTTSGTYTFTVQVSDGASPAATFQKPLSITVAAAGSSGSSISTSMLGNANNISLTGGVLTAATDLASTDGRVKLSFQANTALNLAGQTSLAANNESNPPAAADNSSMLRAYSFTPAGAIFNPAATMTLQYDTSSVPAGVSESSLYIAYWTGSAWQSLSSTVNTTNHTVSAVVSHFTIFAVRAPAASTGTGTTGGTGTGGSTGTGGTTTTTTPTTVSTSLLGTSGSFSVSSGTVGSGVSLASSDSKVSISIASGTAINLQGSQQLNVVQIASPPAAPTGGKVVAAYTFEPNNATFSPPLTVTIKYDAADIPADVNESSLYIALLEGSSWAPLSSTVNSSARTVTAQVSHFSTYGLLGTVSTTSPTTEPTTPTSTSTSPFILADLTVTPEAARAGEQVTISVRVINGGAAEADKVVALKLNDKFEAQKTVTLGPGKSQVVSFMVSKDAGSYTVTIDNLNASLQVTAGGAGAAQPSGMSLPVLGIVVAGGLAVIILVIVLIVRQRQ